MKVKPLYRYENADGSITITPEKRSETDVPHTYRLIADEGYLLVKGDVKTPCIDTNDIDGWTEEVDPDYPEEEEEEE